MTCHETIVRLCGTLSARAVEMEDGVCRVTLPVPGADGHDLTFFVDSFSDGRQILSDRGMLAFELSVFGIERAALARRLSSVSTDGGIASVTLEPEGSIQVALPDDDIEQAQRLMKQVVAATSAGWALRFEAREPSLRSSLSGYLTRTLKERHPQLPLRTNVTRKGRSGVERRFHIQVGYGGQLLGRTSQAESAAALKDRAELLMWSASDLRGLSDGDRFSFFFSWDDDLASPSRPVLAEFVGSRINAFPRSEIEEAVDVLAGLVT